MSEEDCQDRTYLLDSEGVIDEMCKSRKEEMMRVLELLLKAEL